ncbi:DUF4087 domain-containing protein [Bradyrhizobium iriomotense]|uniref:DUF4087 domain-containing protein n=1 Tax=Bradyrhizobium iriomotense TaxID=441950 RepID=UPI001B89EE09|nr:DUF4087 domain-containing protein [Bradyrhizobium iriomotense]MBR0781076.1 DUF4087 domain-containing protein [Bradyrhizobium iriomotense]
MFGPFRHRHANLAILGGVLLVIASAPVQAKEMRCGWLHNPTPANWYLEDRDGRWVLGEQGRYQAPGLLGMPDFTQGEWVKTNTGSYGYGCACATVNTNRTGMTVTRLFSAKQKPLADCRADKSLAAP